MLSPNPPPYILQELPDLTAAINYPIQNVQRIKYTCFDISKTLIAFGATSGGIYVFNRSPCEFVQLIPNKDGAVTRVAISSNGKHIGFANGRGIVTVTDCEQSLSGGHSTVTSKDHQGNEVTAMVWSDRDNMLFSGDDIGKISVLQMQNFIAKTFQSSSQVIMSLDSRICQMDVKSCMLLVSTLTRCYICDTVQEQYRQIGQKLRDGEFGACFVNKKKITQQNDIARKEDEDFTELKTYNMVNYQLKFAVGEELQNILIYCARPSSRLWQSSIDGTVKRTLQYKEELHKQPQNFVSVDAYENETYKLQHRIEKCNTHNEGKSIVFSKIFYVINDAIFCFGKDALYFLNTENVEDTAWFEHKDIVDCRVYQNMLYVWLSNGSLKNFRFMKIDKFLLKCYVEEKFVLCTEICSYYSEYLRINNLSPKLHILAGLREKVSKDVIENINTILDKFETLQKDCEVKSGIHVVDNTYHTKSSLDDEEYRSENDNNKFTTLPPEAMQTLKDLSLTVSGKLNSSKKILKETWEGFEDKMKHLGDRPTVPDARDVKSEFRESNNIEIPKLIPLELKNYDLSPLVIDEDILYIESSQKAIEVDTNIVDKDKVSKSLYQYFRLSLVSKDEKSNLISIIECNTCDIREIFNLMLKLEEYCVNIGADEESKFIPNHIFLSYLSLAPKRSEHLDVIITDEGLYKYFVDSCISVNMKNRKLSNIGCKCGFPLPFARTNETPVFAELIDEFIELQWSKQTMDQCYDICKRMPYLWRKILYLRRNEDLMNILQIILQMLDESLLHLFLPQFTLDIWNRAVQLYATLYANICLNCSKKFDNISVKDMLSWDDLGGLMIKSIGGKNAIKVMQTHANLIEPGGITVKFYHTCLLVTMFEKYDATVTCQLTDSLYSSYKFQDAGTEICKLLRRNLEGEIKNTALPIIVAVNTKHWRITPLKKLVINVDNNETIPENDAQTLEFMSHQEIVDNLQIINNRVGDCVLCGLPLQNEVLIKDGGLWVFKCGHIFHGACLEMNKLKLCPSCSPVK